MENEPLGPRIRRFRKARGMGLKEAKPRAKSVSWMSRMEKGEIGDLSVPDLIEIAANLYVSPAELGGILPSVGELPPMPPRPELDERIKRLAEIGERVVEVVRDTPSFIVPEERIRVVAAEPEEVELVPMQVYDRFAANYLGSAGSQVHETVMVPKHLRDRAKDPRLVVATGDCLATRRILSGDHLIVDAAQQDPQDGQIVAFRFRGEDAVKVCYRFEDRIEFRPAVETYPTIVVKRSEVDELEIVGVVVARVPQPGEDEL